MARARFTATSRSSGSSSSFAVVFERSVVCSDGTALVNFNDEDVATASADELGNA
jgi:hypothetical protein